MPDFNSQRPQEPNTLNSRLRTVLVANWLRIAWIGVGMLFVVMVVVPGGLLIYQYSGIGDRQQNDQQQAVGPETVTCDETHLLEDGACIPPSSRGDSLTCEGKSRDVVMPSEGAGEGYCEVLTEREKKGCAVWVVETGECIPDAETDMCDDYMASKDDSCSPPQGSGSVSCYEHYLPNSCIEPSYRDVVFPR
jgi:hypothetical protein